MLRISTSPISGYSLKPLGSHGYIELIIEAIPLTAGSYSLDVGIAQPNVAMIVSMENVMTFEVAPSDVYGSGVALDQTRGLIVVAHEWIHYPEVALSRVAKNV